MIAARYHLGPRAGHPMLPGMPDTPERIDELVAMVNAFATERDWDQYHTPRNLLLALVAEVGELAEIVRWQGDSEPAIPEDRQQDWNDEIADVLILLVRLADRTGVDIGQAFAHKLAKAGEKYPVDRFKGSNRKYNDPPPGRAGHQSRPTNES